MEAFGRIEAVETSTPTLTLRYAPTPEDSSSPGFLRLMEEFGILNTIAGGGLSKNEAKSIYSMALFAQVGIDGLGFFYCGCYLFPFLCFSLSFVEISACQNSGCCQTLWTGLPSFCESNDHGFIGCICAISRSSKFIFRGIHG